MDVEAQIEALNTACFRVQDEYDESMGAERVTVTVPAELLRAAREEVQAGRRPSVSAVVTSALAEHLRRQRMEQVLDEIDAEHGPPSAEATEWAKRALAED